MNDTRISQNALIVVSWRLNNIWKNLVQRKNTFDISPLNDMKSTVQNMIKAGFNRLLQQVITRDVPGQTTRYTGSTKYT